MLFPNCPTALYAAQVHGIDVRCILWASERFYERYPFWAAVLGLICVAMLFGTWVAYKHGESEMA
jgi:hypothetical protein